MKNKRINIIKKYYIQIICILTTFAVLMVCSKCSPLYVFNDWADANCFLTVGKAMFKGTVPYRDIYEQKGPLLYFIYGIGGIFSGNTFYTIFIFEVIFGSIFLYYSYKTILLLGKKASVMWISIIGTLIYSSTSFAFGGSAEEFCLPILAYSFYVLVQYYVKKCDDEDRNLLPNNIINYKIVFILGILAGCVLWIKYTLLGFYIGLVIVISFEYLMTKKYKQLGKSAFIFVGGVLVASLPWIIYFALNNALADMWKTYFYDNIFVYSDLNKETIPSILLKEKYGTVISILNKFKFNLQYSSLIIVGVITIAIQYIKRQTNFVIAMFVIVASTTLFLMGFGRIFKYYFLPMAVFVPLGASFISSRVNEINLSQNMNKKINMCAAIITSIMLIIFAYTVSPNSYMIRMNKSQLPQYQFAEIINKSDDTTLLNYGWLDGGFYTASGISPTCKYFCKVNMKLEDMEREQDRFLENGLVDYVVSRDNNLESKFPKYKNLAKSTYYPGEKSNRTWYLYRLQKEGIVAEK